MPYKCNDCEKTFSTVELAELHGVRKGHEEFEEIEASEHKPRTAEEIKETLDRLREKVKDKRRLEQEQYRLEQKKNAEIASKSNKETGDAIEAARKKTQLKEWEKMRRQKAEDVLARKKILAEIEADKKRRAREREQRQLQREGKGQAEKVQKTERAENVSGTSPSSNTARAPATSSRLSIRHAGVTVNLNVPVEETLGQVCAKVMEKMNLPHEPSAFYTTFPKAEFPQSRFTESLKDLGLVPSAVLLLKE
ncbi:zf-C2H2 type zinc finger protein/UBA domain-containing protein [Schizosaccharomyces japonicus yFS275]|uniref:Zf-C2H2 type zinc finger protein/UBA domain-containing protein n=1 Tax=Schizosaccharomyces japonicus (strain yFS275 / FY16936) TaxID=402676 RepID=B6JUS7_SCHJY|nr:zf-C2H2 type zinc finger protein/UBA domain-containing protein [Schizosaccharomyces japonicus yFS275]EEB05060.1 zf-C2H2 type zinc finger protein/UBA domain-containing protein [Schizosaccharomyces japonicus yFS275]